MYDNGAVTSESPRLCSQSSIYGCDVHALLAEDRAPHILVRNSRNLLFLTSAKRELL